MVPKKKPGAPAGAQPGYDQTNRVKHSSQVVDETQLSFPFSSEVTRHSFGQSFQTWARSDALPLQGQTAAHLLAQIRPDREALDLIEARMREAIAANPDSVPGWGLAPGAQVRETFRVSALKVWQALNRAPQNLPLNVRDMLACCRINWGELVERLFDEVIATRESVGWCNSGVSKHGSKSGGWRKGRRGRANER
jgi:hypothetical protein